MSTASIIPGRTYDVAAFQGQKSSGEVLLTAALAVAGNAGNVLTGVAKLAQRVLLEFFTEQGTMPFQPSRGTTFPFAARTGLLRTDLDVFQQFAFAAGDLAQNLKGDETTADPDDERFGSLDLTGVVLTPGRVTLRTKLTSRAGTAHAVIMPVPTSP